MKRIVALLMLISATIGLVAILHGSIADLPPLGNWLDPLDGFYRTARHAETPTRASIEIPGLKAPVTVERDDRGVPHIFAENDHDAVMALGYVVAQDRLFEMDFIPRVAAGRLSEAFGTGALASDRFLRRTGMDWGAHRNVERILREGGIERDLMLWYADGANAYIDGLDDADLPFEFRLLGYRPDRYSPLQMVRLLQYMTYDLTYRTDDASYAKLKAGMPEADFDLLYPRFSQLFKPIVPDEERHRRRISQGGGTAMRAIPGIETMTSMENEQALLRGLLSEGFITGKGSNNWAVSGLRSTTSAPILAGDMHLSLTLPAIWYEVHLVTPTMNTYGVTIPGAALPVEAFNDRLAWAFTNTGADQIDHYALKLDSTRTQYWFDGEFRQLEMVSDTIRIKGGALEVDTLYYARWGPVTMGQDGAVALQWVAHKQSHTMRALWGMNHATDYTSFEEALHSWDTPMQNILYAGVDGKIAIRSTGYLPIRRAGEGMGLLDGATRRYEWTGRVPFVDLPHISDPERGYLASSNQQPAGAWYPYYLGYDWRAAYRSLRIDTLLNGKLKHSVEDLESYQSDVHAVQRDLFVPLLDTLGGLNPLADRLRGMLSAWDGVTSVDRSEPLVLETFLKALGRLAWDEHVFSGLRKPAETRLYRLLVDQPDSKWLDVQVTPERENAADILRMALDSTVARLAQTYGSDPARWRWGDHHKIVFRHITQSEALRPLWRGPFEYPGYIATVSPGASHRTTHSASWRVVVDLSQTPPRGYGVYPGGASGNPFSPDYDRQIDDYVHFRHYDLIKPTGVDGLGAKEHSRLMLNPYRIAKK